ncbi:DUF4190 domain-containing protein [Prosthecobacter sp.]|uniref:DUF4190 domain-containing protein n=1 Tax=Prosthecobacter sp. TaxID=1965333 RepID=UPI003784C75E
MQTPPPIPTPPPQPVFGMPQPPPMAAPTKMADSAAMRMLLPVGRSGWAIAAGYLGLFGLVILPAPLALIISIVAIRDIRKSKRTPNPKHGMGRAIFGLIVGVAGTAVLISMIVAGALK